jgi:hypothetical protein
MSTPARFSLHVPSQGHYSSFNFAARPLAPGFFRCRRNQQRIHKANFTDPRHIAGVNDTHHERKKDDSVHLATAVLAELEAAGYQIAKAKT